MKTITIGLPIRLATEITDRGKLNPTDMRFYLYKAIARLEMNNGILHDFVKCEEVSSNKFHYSLKVDDMLKDDLDKLCEEFDMTMLDFTYNLLSNYWLNIR